MADRSPVEKVRLLLGKMDDHPVYTHRMFGDATGSPRRIEATLHHPTAIAIRNLVHAVQAEGTRAAAEAAIVDSIDSSNFEVVGALIVELGLYRHLPRNTLLTQSVSRTSLFTRALASTLSNAPDLVTESALDAIHDWATNAVALFGVNVAAQEARRLTSLKEAVLDIERERLRHTLLRQTNPVIDRDRREVGTRLDALKADAKIFGLLDDADGEARIGRFEDALHALRKFLEQVMIVAVADNDPTTGVGKFKIRKDRALSLRLLSEEEGEVFQKLYNLLSVEGSHSLGSEAELFGVCHATVVEWALLLLGRVKRASRA